MNRDAVFATLSVIENIDAGQPVHEAIKELSQAYRSVEYESKVLYIYSSQIERIVSGANSSDRYISADEFARVILVPGLRMEILRDNACPYCAEIIEGGKPVPFTSVLPHNILICHCCGEEQKVLGQFVSLALVKSEPPPSPAPPIFRRGQIRWE